MIIKTLVVLIALLFYLVVNAGSEEWIHESTCDKDCRQNKTAIACCAHWDYPPGGECRNGTQAFCIRNQ